MSSQAARLCNPQEYLQLERQSPTRSEFLSGRIYAMAGASRSHNLIASNIARDLNTHFRGTPCESYASDMRVKVNQTGLYTYPDIVAVCDDIQFEDDQSDTLLNPIVIIEVLSRSTEAYDRGEKFAHYRRIDSLMDYVLVAQETARVEHYARQTDSKWLLTEFSDLTGCIILSSLNMELKLADIYEKVQFAPTSALTMLETSGTEMTVE